MFVRRILMTVVLGVVCFISLNSALLAGDDSGINLKTLTKLAKDKDKAVAYTATAQLAAYYRREGDLKKAEKVLSKFSSPSGFDRLPAKVAIPYLRCLLENAHIKALKKDLPGALMLLNWAESRKRDYERAFSCMKYAEILLDLNETERANAYLKNVNKILAKHINESAVSGGAIGQGSKALDTESTWRTLRDQADHFALEIEEVQLSKKFGATYASYVKLRRLQRIVKRSKSPRYFSEAIKLCDEIEESDPESQFAAAAGYLKAQLLLKNPTQDPKKAIKEAKDQLEKFIKSNPEGLYRGEALMLLGKISLEKEWDAKDAEKYYSQALNWFKQAREKRNAMSLYAPMSNDLKTQTNATQKPTTLNKWRRTVHHKEDPLRLYNTVSSPSWYTSDKEKNCFFILGFCKYLNENYKEAGELWAKASTFDPNIMKMEAANWPNALKRLKAVARYEKMAFTKEEKKLIKNKRNKIRIQTAELYYMLEDFSQMGDLFNEVINDKASSNDEKALSYIGLGICKDMTTLYMKSSERIALAQCFQKAMKLTKSKEIKQDAMFRIACYMDCSSATKKYASEIMEEMLKKYPKGIYVEKIMFRQAMSVFSPKMDKCIKIFKKMQRKFPDGNYTKALAKRIEKSEEEFKRIKTILEKSKHEKKN
jgi:tetratricopeptide (TPR) repeat protein